MPKSFPVHPTQAAGHYEAPAFPCIQKSDPLTTRCWKIVNAYRAAMEFHTGVPCRIYAQKIPGNLYKFLGTAADIFEKHHLSPYIWAVVIIQWQRDTARAEERTWRAAPLRSLFAHGFIEKMHGMVRSQSSGWVCGYTPERLADLCVSWQLCHRELRRAACDFESSPDDLEAIVQKYFPPGFYLREIHAAKAEMTQKFTDSVMRMQNGHWVWG